MGNFKEKAYILIKELTDWWKCYFKWDLINICDLLWGKGSRRLHDFHLKEHPLPLGVYHFIFLQNSSIIFHVLLNFRKSCGLI
jgi:hypothetical protein